MGTLGVGVEVLHQVHALLRVDRAVDDGILQAQSLQVHHHNFEHACPLGHNHTANTHTHTHR